MQWMQTLLRLIECYTQGEKRLPFTAVCTAADLQGDAGNCSGTWELFLLKLSLPSRYSSGVVLFMRLRHNHWNWGTNLESHWDWETTLRLWHYRLRLRQLLKWGCVICEIETWSLRLRYSFWDLESHWDWEATLRLWHCGLRLGVLDPSEAAVTSSKVLKWGCVICEIETWSLRLRWKLRKSLRLRLRSNTETDIILLKLLLPPRYIFKWGCVIHETETKSLGQLLRLRQSLRLRHDHWDWDTIFRPRQLLRLRLRLRNNTDTETLSFWSYHFLQGMYSSGAVSFMRLRPNHWNWDTVHETETVTETEKQHWHWNMISETESASSWSCHLHLGTQVGLFHSWDWE